jgi:hypothetical protein
LCANLNAAATAAARGDTKGKVNGINAYINDVKAQSGKSMTVAQANILIRMARAL